MRAIDPAWAPVELVVPAMRAGRRLLAAPPLAAVQARAGEQLRCLHPAIRRLLNPHVYPVGLEMRLHERRTAQVLERRKLQIPN
jgi:nicotinate phosphoribosyltransferase